MDPLSSMNTSGTLFFVGGGRGRGGRNMGQLLQNIHIIHMIYRGKQKRGPNFKQQAALILYDICCRAAFVQPTHPM